jgi:hypothetical protein
LFFFFLLLLLHDNKDIATTKWIPESKIFKQERENIPAIPTFWPPLHTAQAIEEAPSTLVKVPPFLLPRSRQRILLLRHRHPALDSAVPPPSPYPLQALVRKCDQSRYTESQTHTEEKASHLSNKNLRSRQQKTYPNLLYILWIAAAAFAAAFFQNHGFFFPRKREKKKKNNNNNNSF